MLMPVFRLVVIYVALALVVVGVFNRDKLMQLVSGQSPAQSEAQADAPSAAPAGATDAPAATAQATPQPAPQSTAPAQGQGFVQGNGMGNGQGNGQGNGMGNGQGNGQGNGMRNGQGFGQGQAAGLQTPVAPGAGQQAPQGFVRPLQPTPPQMQPMPGQQAQMQPQMQPGAQGGPQAVDPELAEAVNAARQAYWSGDQAGAQAQLEELVAAHPDNADLMGELGNFHFSAQHYPEAAEAYEAAGKLLAEQGRGQQAMSLLPVLARLDPARAQALAETLGLQ